MQLYINIWQSAYSVSHECTHTHALKLTFWQADFSSLLHLLFNSYFYFTVSSPSFSSLAHYLSLLPSLHCLPTTPDLFSVLVTPSQCWRLDGEVPALSDSQVQRHPMNFFTERAGMRFQGACNHTNTHTAYTNTLILFSSPTHCSSSPSFNLLFLATPLFLPHSSRSPFSFALFFPLPSLRLSSPVSELSLADAPDGSTILEHLSAVCLHHRSSAATEATGK